jgi:Flp pilus assembly pilin Flp
MEAGVYRAMRRSGELPNGVNFWTDERGQDLVEYAMIVAAVALALLVTVTSLSGAISQIYQSITGKLTGIEWQEAKR